MNKLSKNEFYNKELEKIKINISKKNYSDAIKKLKKIIKTFPDKVFLYNFLGLSYKLSKNFENAEKVYNKALKIKPNDISILLNLALFYSESRRYLDADIVYKKILKLNPNLTSALSNYGNLMRDINKFDDAIVYYNKALNKDPENKTALYNLIGAYQIIGDFKKSKQLIDIYNKKFGENIIIDHMLSLITDYKIENTHQKKMIDKINNKNLKDNEKVILNFAIGKSYFDQKEFKKSFDYYKEGNRINKLLSNIDISFEQNKFKLIKEMFKKYNFTSKSHLNNQKIIFIVGLPRSGTTLLHQILSAHPDIYGAGELPIIGDFCYDNFFTKDFRLNFIKKDNYKLVKDYSEAIIKKIKYYNKNKIILDKTPSNFEWLGFIKIFFPNSKIIHLKRNLKDNAFSIYRNLFLWSRFKWCYDEQDIIKYIELYKDLMKFWNSKFEKSIYEISYEEIIDDQINQTTKLLNFCDLPWSDDCKNFQKNNSPVKTLSVYQSRKPIYKSSKNVSDKFLKFLPFLKELDI